MTPTLLTFLGEIHPILRDLSGLPLVVFLIVSALTSLFVLGYLLQGGRVGWQLARAVRRVRKLGRSGQPVKPSAVAEVLKSEPFQHLWDEYDDTLHELKKASNGTTAVTEVRATVPAEMFFTREVLVDSRMFDDFTRHLPGVLTGLGIIGTFAGLLDGLGKFDASTTATAVAGLKPLLDGVAHAFVASAIAIGCAMGVTFASRLVLAWFYRLVEKLNHAIDALYSTGAGEEYLSRLVRSSENAEAHAAQLKQALVEDLTTMMTNLVERQIQAQAESSRALGAHIGEAITGTLAGPLEQMTQAMKSTSEGNSQAVNGMLNSALTGFMAQLKDTFGDQMLGIREQIDRSAGVMTNVQQALHKLVDDMNRSNEQATNRMSGTLEEAIKQSAANQQLLTGQMREFLHDFQSRAADEQMKSKNAMNDALAALVENVNAAVGSLEDARKAAQANESARNEELATRTHKVLEDMTSFGARSTARLTTAVDEVVKQSAGTQAQMADQMRALVEEMQTRSAEDASKSRQAMDESVGKVLQQLSSAVEQMELTRRSSASQEQTRNEQLANRTDALVDGLSGQVETLLKTVSEQVSLTQRNIDAIGSVATRAIEGMNSGALNMGTAAQRFETAGGAVASVFDRSVKVTEQLEVAASSLQTAASAIQRGFEQYETTRKTVDANVGALTALIESAKREAGLSKEMLSDLERVVGQLKLAETQSLQYLEGVNNALATSFESFGNQLRNQIKGTIGETDRHLGTGVQQLNGVVQEIGAALARLKRA